MDLGAIESALATPYCFYSVDTISSCPEDTVELDAGNAYTSYEWNTGDTTSQISVSVFGQYEVIVIDTSGCTGGFSFLYAPPYSIELNILGNQPTCANEHIGTISTNATVGTVPYV